MSTGNSGIAGVASRASLLKANASGATRTNRMLSPVLSRAMEQHCEETAAADLGNPHLSL